jgi:hypothetical protein
MVVNVLRLFALFLFLALALVASPCDAQFGGGGGNPCTGDLNSSCQVTSQHLSAPASATATATVPGSAPYTQYSYVVTAVDAVTGEESVASNVANITQSVDIAVTAGSHIIGWNPVPGAAYYNIYQAPAAYDTAVPIATNFGFIGQSFGTQFVNSNIVPDFATTPPLHINPFARGQIAEVNVTNAGSGLTQAGVGYTVNTATGSGFIGLPIVVSGALVAFYVENAGQNYLPGDTITITMGGAGGSPLTVYSVTVWQRSTGQNLLQ